MLIVWCVAVSVSNEMLSADALNIIHIKWNRIFVQDAT
jgi:hypothetical protein